MVALGLKLQQRYKIIVARSRRVADVSSSYNHATGGRGPRLAERCVCRRRAITDEWLRALVRDMRARGFWESPDGGNGGAGVDAYMAAISASWERVARLQRGHELVRWSGDLLRDYHLAAANKSAVRGGRMRAAAARLAATIGPRDTSALYCEGRAWLIHEAAARACTHLGRPGTADINYPCARCLDAADAARPDGLQARFQVYDEPTFPGYPPEPCSHDGCTEEATHERVEPGATGVAMLCARHATERSRA